MQKAVQVFQISLMADIWYFRKDILLNLSVWLECDDTGFIA